MRAPLAATAALVLLAACTHDTGSAAQPTPSTEQAAPVGVPYDPGTAPEWFVHRAQLPVCGYVTRKLDEGDAPADLVRCLDGAAGGELGVAQYTDEGDPVVAYFRRYPGDADTILVTDATRDKFGSRTWSREVCTDFSVTTRQGKSCHPTDRV